MRIRSFAILFLVLLLSVSVYAEETAEVSVSNDVNTELSATNDAIATLTTHIHAKHRYKLQRFADTAREFESLNDNIKKEACKCSGRSHETMTVECAWCVFEQKRAKLLVYVLNDPDATWDSDMLQPGACDTVCGGPAPEPGW